MALSQTDLLRVFIDGIKAPEKRSIGIEKECFLYNRSTGKRLVYDEINSVLESFFKLGYSYTFEKETIIGCTKNGINLSLEPGGQFEISTLPHLDLHKAYNEITTFDNQLDVILHQRGFFKREIGFEPLWAQRDLPWMTKERYAIMRRYMPLKGNHGLDMMRRTCTLQINLDYISETNMRQMMFLTHALTPLVSGLFAASPFYEGKFSGYKSFRNFVWQDTDPDRCGLLPFVFNQAMTFEDYLNYLLDVPMYFVYRGGDYIHTAGASFKDFMKGELKEYPGHVAIMDDFYDQMTVAFPEVRLKKYIEIRCIDASPIAFAAAALFVGLLYCNSSLERALNFVSDWTFSKVQDQYVRIPREGLSKREWCIAEQIYAMAWDGLKERRLGEEKFLEPLQRIIAYRKTYSDDLVENADHSISFP